MKRIFSAILAVVVLSIIGQATNLYLSRGSLYSSQKKAAETQGTTVKGSKSNSDNRAADDKDSPKTITGKVIRANEKDKTLTVTANGKDVTFDAKKLKALPAVGEVIDITYTQTPGGPLEATNLNTSRSNAYKAASDDKNTPKAITGKVIRVNDKDKTFVVMVDGKEATFAGRKLKALPKVGATIDLKPNTARFVFDTCEECNSVCPGVCFLQGVGSCRCYLEHLPTQHN